MESESLFNGPTRIPGKTEPAAPPFAAPQMEAVNPAGMGQTSLRGLTSLPGYSEAGLYERAIDRYKVVKSLGAGGMGEVALVQDQDIERKVAVKYLRSDVASPPLVARFVEEIRNVGRLEHPNIVPIYDAGRDDTGRYFFVMKHVEGETLESIINKLRAGDSEYLAKYTHLERVEIFIGLLNALKFAHDKGFIHRDIKPANVMVGPAGEVMLMDWGLSKSLSSTTPEPALNAPLEPSASAARLVQTGVGAVMGTPYYMSPEQAAGRNAELGVQSDLYSATVVFHELMFLEHYLEDRKSVEEVLAGVATEMPKTDLFAYRSPAAAPYIHIARKGMQKDPALRFQSADELIASLRAVQDGTAPVQCPVTATRRVTTELTRFVDRSPRAAMAAIGTTLLLTLAGVGSGVVALLHAILH